MRYAPRPKRKRRLPLSKMLFAWGAVVLAGLVLTGAISLAIIIKNLPSPDQLNAREIVQSTKLYDRTGKVLLYEIHGEEKRTVVPFNEIPERVKQATLAAEDANFYDEPAFDWKAIVRAIIVNIREGKITQGGSTITQQLVKNVFLSPERTVVRKVKELILATELESRHSKDEIFSFYLNQIPYGSNAYGVEAASQVYFGKSVRELSLPEAAIIAALPKAPSYYSPWGSHIKELNERKEYVLDRMAELGFITSRERDTAKSAQLSFSPPSLGTIQAPHFALAVKDYLIRQYGENLVTNGGLKVITTLDWDLQEIAERAVKEGSARNNELYGSANAALVAQNPKTGQVLALVGSREYFGTPEPEGCTPGRNCKFEGNFNVPVQGLRQPGSALKPFVYLTAFQKGYPQNTTVFDVSTEFDVRDDPETSYRPVNFDGLVRGPVSFEQALAQSLNIPAVKVLYLAGFDDVLKNLHAFGISTLRERWRYGLSLTLGGGEVKLGDLVNAYATLSQEGVHHEQTMVLKVEDYGGRVHEEYHDRTTRVAGVQEASMVTRILTDPDLRYPIFRSSNALTIFPNHEVAIKTGTSEDHRDAWTVGYTPFLVAGVWAGNNDNTPMIRQGSSILAAVPIWNAFLKEVLPRYQTEVFAKPDPVPAVDKPMFDGQSEHVVTSGGRRYPQLHSILYYLNRADPTGPPPMDPKSDPQFENWERGVTEWARLHIPNFFSYNLPVPETATFEGGLRSITDSGGPIVRNLEPPNGEFVRSPLTIKAELTAPNGLSKVELYWNRRLLNAVWISGASYRYEYFFYAQLEPQNSIEIRVYDRLGKVGNASAVVFR